MRRPPPHDLILPAGILLLAACADETSLTRPGAPDAAVAALANSWSPRAPMPTGRTWHVAGAANNRAGEPILYVFGGYDTDAEVEEESPLRSVEAYNYATDNWTPRSDAPFDLLRVNGVGKAGGKFYLAGGGFETGNGFERHGFLLSYDPALDTWTRLADMPRPGSEGVSGVIDGKLFVLPGFDNIYLPDGTPCPDCGPGVLARRLYRYNPATNTWATRPWCPNFHARGAAGVIGGKLYVAGGLEPSGSSRAASRKLDIYDPATNKWTSGAPMPSARASVTGVVQGGRLYVIGPPNGEVTVYDPKTDSWSTRAPLPTPRFLVAAARIVFEGSPRILAVGGNPFEHGHVNEAYTP